MFPKTSHSEQKMTQKFPSLEPELRISGCHCEFYNANGIFKIFSKLKCYILTKKYIDTGKAH